MRISYPEGNRVKGELRGSRDLRAELKQKIKVEQDRQIDDIIGGKERKAKKKKTSKGARKTTRRKSNKRPLKDVFPGGKMIYATWHGKEYKAWVLSNGGIRYKGKIYDTPSGAGGVVRKGKSTNGWIFWKYTNNAGELVKINLVRR